MRRTLNEAQLLERIKVPVRSQNRFEVQHCAWLHLGKEERFWLQLSQAERSLDPD